MSDIFATRLKDIRKQKGWNQKELADKTGLSFRTIGAYETDARKPSLSLLSHIAHALNCSVDYLLGVSNTPNIDNVCLSDDQKAALNKIINSLIKEPYMIDIFNLLIQLDKDNLLEVKGEVKQMLKNRSVKNG